MFSKTFLKTLRSMVDELLDIAEEIKSAKYPSARIEYLLTRQTVLSDELKKVFDDY